MNTRCRFAHALIPALIAGVMTFTWIRLFSIGRQDPFAFGDETLLMYKAHVWDLFGQWFAPEGFQDIGTDYAPLYSVFASSVFRGRDLVAAYPRVLVLNAAVLALGVTLFHIMLVAYAVDWRSAFATALCTGFSAGYAGYGTMAMSEALFLPLFLCCLPPFLRKEHNTWLDAAYLAVILALLLLTRKQGIGLLLGIPLALGVKNLSCHNKMKTVVFCLIPPLAGIAAWTVVKRLTSGGIQTPGNYLAHLVAEWQVLLSLKPVCGQLTYVHAATGCLLPLALFHAFREWRNGRRESLCIAILCVIAALPGLAHMYVHPGMVNVRDSRYWMYGRYIDMAVPAVILLAMLAVFSGRSCGRRGRFALLSFAVAVSLVALLTPRTGIVPTINMGFGWIRLVERSVSAPIGRVVATLVMSLLVSIPVLSRKAARFTWGIAISCLFLSAASMGVLRVSEKGRIANSRSIIDSLLRLREMPDAVFYPKTHFMATTDEYRAWFYLADRYWVRRPDALPDNAWLVRDDGTIRSATEDTRLFISLLDRFDDASIVASPSGNPWKSSVAKDTDPAMGKGIVITHWGASIAFPDIPIPDTEDCVLRFSVGFYTHSKSWGVSDGVNARVCIVEDGKQTVIYNKRVLPEDPVQTTTIPLDRFRAKLVSIVFSAPEPQGNGNGDWLFFGNPELFK